MSTFLIALLVVVLAELGDKTQLLAMAFASKYRCLTVMSGVFVATLLNHFMAVVGGKYVGMFFDANILGSICAICFIIFGIWTLKGDELQGEDERKYYSPFLTVVIVFFLAEMADKTQMATITLAAKYQSVAPVLIGTTAGMMLADGAAVLAGTALYRILSPRKIKYFVGSVFILSGLAAFIIY